MGAKGTLRAESRWRALIAEQEASGASVAEFAERRGSCAATIYWWRSRLRRGARTTSQIVPVEIVGAPRVREVRRDGHFELELPRGRRVQVPPGFDERELARLIAAVERAC